MAYNNARFGAPLEMGYARIPNILSEENYRYGIMSIRWEYIARNAATMFGEPWLRIPNAPWIVPSPWGGNIFAFSPFLLLLFIPAQREQWIKLAAIPSMVLILAVVFCHGDPGEWQISYRYALTCLPWALLLLANGKPRIKTEIILIVAAIALNAYATCLFLHTRITWLYNRM